MLVVPPRRLKSTSAPAYLRHECADLRARAAIWFCRFGRRFGGCVGSGRCVGDAQLWARVGARFGFDAGAFSLQAFGGDGPIGAFVMEAPCQRLARTTAPLSRYTLGGIGILWNLTRG